MSDTNVVAWLWEVRNPKTGQWEIWDSSIVDPETEGYSQNSGVIKHLGNEWRVIPLIRDPESDCVRLSFDEQKIK